MIEVANLMITLNLVIESCIQPNIIVHEILTYEDISPQN